MKRCETIHEADEKYHVITYTLAPDFKSLCNRDKEILQEENNVYMFSHL